jgi:excisionase family DNA binding protein
MSSDDDVKPKGPKLRPRIPGVDPADWLTAGEVREILAVCLHTVYRLIRRGELPAFQTVADGPYWLKRPDVLAYLQRLQVVPVVVDPPRFVCPVPAPRVQACTDDHGRAEYEAARRPRLAGKAVGRG